MARSLLGPTIITAMNAAQTDVVVLAALSISHPAITTLRLVNNTENITKGGNTWQAFPFTVSLPPAGDDAVPVARVVVDNIDRQVVQSARTIAGSTAGLATANLYIVNAAAPDTNLLSFTDYRVQNVRYTAEALTFDMTLEFYQQEPFPAMQFTPGRFAGLF